MTHGVRPNILFIVFDSLSAQQLENAQGAYPAIETVREKSVNFTNAYAPSAQSGPARATLFTGLDMAAHGVWRDGVALPDREQPLAHRFTEFGYQTWLVGRRQLTGVSHWTTEHARPNEYTHFEWAHGPLHRSRQNAYLNWLKDSAPEQYSAIFPAQPNPDDTAIPKAQRAAMEGIPEGLSFNAWVGAGLSDQIQNHAGDGPFLAMAGFVVGDTMGAGPREGHIVEAVNETALGQADRALARMVKALEQAQVLDKTFIVVVSARGAVDLADRAELLGQSALKVPLMIQAPGQAAAMVPTPVSTMDVAPTLYALADVSPPQRLQGVPLPPASQTPCRGWALARVRHAALGAHTAVCTQDWKLVVSHESSHNSETPHYALYDLKADPPATQNLATQNAFGDDLDRMLDVMIDARVALEDRTEPRIAKF